jgi:hypothetical protein
MVDYLATNVEWNDALKGKNVPTLEAGVEREG